MSRLFPSGVANYLAAGIALCVAVPAQATSCDDRRIAAMSLEEAAQSLWDGADVVGFGVVSIVDTPEREQQFIEMLVSFKGPTGKRLDYAPLRIGRIGAVGPGLYRLDPGPDGIMFLTLTKTERGYVVPACSQLVLAKNPAAIIHLLQAIARRGG
jgi:hypothetical protein